MKTTVGRLRTLIHEAFKDCWGGSRPEETYDQTLDEDEAYKKNSVLVPDDIKKSINSWMGQMGLTRPRKRSRRT